MQRPTGWQGATRRDEDGTDEGAETTGREDHGQRRYR